MAKQKGKTANILSLIDIQNGFARFDIPENMGGCLYVPGGEDVGAKAAELIAGAKNSVIVLSQDFHPANHISFMSNHPGVVAYRRELLKKAGKNPEEYLNVLELPFTDMVLDKNRNIVGVATDGGMYQVALQNGRIAVVLTATGVVPIPEGSSTQTLWRQHCTQGTESALFVPEIMALLPEQLVRELKNPALSNQKTLMGFDRNGNGNMYVVVRKGMNSELDSYGIATENDGVSKTEAPKIFGVIADYLKRKGFTKANISNGGLATNFCVEFSDSDLHSDFVPALKAQGIEGSISFDSDISAGIPLTVPNGAWPDYANAPARMAARGTILLPTLAATCPAAAPKKKFNIFGIKF